MHGSIKFPQGLNFIPDSNKPESAIFVSSLGSLFPKDLTFRAYSRVPTINVLEQNQRTNGPVNAHLIPWPTKAQNIQNLDNI